MLDIPLQDERQLIIGGNSLAKDKFAFASAGNFVARGGEELVQKDELFDSPHHCSNNC